MVHGQFFGREMAASCMSAPSIQMHLVSSCDNIIFKTKFAENVYPMNKKTRVGVNNFFVSTVEILFFL
jgi:hypothetical protein